MSGDNGLLESLLANTARLGRSDDQMRVVSCAAALTGRSYRQTEELADDTIDCSTLTSQSHWLGAGIGIPFTADGQRRATNCRAIEISQLEPGDVVVRYADIARSSDSHNHVALYVGTDDGGCGWIIESASGQTSCFRAFVPEEWEGGGRRFLIDQNCPSDSDYLLGRRLAHLVPKLGRLGASQYLSSEAARVRHQGVDIYCDRGTQVVAPLAGSISYNVMPGEGGASALTITGSAGASVLLGHVEPTVSEGAAVSAGEPIGYVLSPPSQSPIEYSSYMGGLTHVHFELPHSPMNPVRMVMLGRMGAPLMLT